MCVSLILYITGLDHAHFSKSFNLICLSILLSSNPTIQINAQVIALTDKRHPDRFDTYNLISVSISFRYYKQQTKFILIGYTK